MKRAALILCLIVPVGCTTFPQVDAAVDADAKVSGFPTIIPLDGLFDAASTTRLDADNGRRLASRVAGLKRRARQISGPVLTNRERKHLLDALERLQN